MLDFLIAAAIVGILFLFVALFVYWGCFYLYDYKDRIHSKREFLKILIPFYFWAVNIKDFYRGLK